MDEPVLYLQSTKPGKERQIFRILSYDRIRKKGMIKGQLAPFEHCLEKEYLLKNQYRVVSAEKLDAEGISFELQKKLCE